MCNKCTPVCEKKPVPHVHAEMMKKFADDSSLVVELQYSNGVWFYTQNPSWNPRCKYRFKPFPKPDVVQYIASRPGYSGMPQKSLSAWSDQSRNIQKQTFDGETGALKSVEIVR